MNDGLIDDLRRTIFRYYFLPEDDNDKEIPLVLCPRCKEDLTKPKSVEVLLVSGDKPLTYMSRLDCGVLQDTPVLNILKGGKEEVTCAHCKCSLADLDSVYEEEMVI